MQETPVFVVVEVVSVRDPEGLRAYAQRASKLIGPLGGAVVGQGAIPVDGEPGFAPLLIQRWTSEGAFRAWLASEAYQPLNAIRLASAEMRVAIVPTVAGPGA
ncbi:uncharacterized protein (DUF1330 family) [Roseiarcus fermentans]|uniref:Uncharacterized protein (DUF1330 family) n=1 Tax=Roseiarcus fermentans TaxID=1473586 RepID=A0A366EZU3_9HYPH|nr:DUF1330 domain-containing protein [Roseiarcus fermentans]RBP07406.1 uncharacterized protein (DUF1330 family) [Roseiarcus fermentans]